MHNGCEFRDCYGNTMRVPRGQGACIRVEPLNELINGNHSPCFLNLHHTRGDIAHTRIYKKTRHVIYCFFSKSAATSAGIVITNLCFLWNATIAARPDSLFTSVLAEMVFLWLLTRSTR